MSSDLEKLLHEIETKAGDTTQVESGPSAEPGESSPEPLAEEQAAGGPEPAKAVGGDGFKSRKRVAFAVFLILILLLFSGTWRW